MAVLYGNRLTREQVLRRVPNPAQIAGITESRYQTGKAAGMRHYSFQTGGGLAFEVLPDRCLDIAGASFRGINLSFLTKNGIVSPEQINPGRGDFPRYMTGGMLMTCGLSNVGPASRDSDGTPCPLHGGIGITPAENPYAREYWDGDDYLLETGGSMRESGLFGKNLLLSRKITTKMGSGTILLEDMLENNAPEDTDFMLLYHFNFGYPFLGPSLKLHFPQGTVSGRDEAAGRGLATCETLQEPEDGFAEQVFFREAADKTGLQTVRLENTALGIGVKLSYEAKNLPVLAQWKSMRSGDYALGIEPSNNYIMGRQAEQKNGTLKTIRGFETLEYRLGLTFYALSPS